MCTTSMHSSCTGSSNLLSFWLKSLHDVLTRWSRRSEDDFEISLDHSEVLIHALKRQGWVLRSNCTTTGDFISRTQG